MNDLSGRKFERLTAIKIVGRTSDNRPAWLCQCDCGKEVVVSEHNLLRNNTKSCGCYKIDVTRATHKKHGLSGARLYRVWKDMKCRCDRENNDNYKWYGARGITYTDEWKRFDSFSRWALDNGYKDTLELDRIDTNGNYEPLNCRFVTHKTNCNNRRNNRHDTGFNASDPLAELK